MSHSIKKICFILTALIAVLFVILYFVKLNTAHYTINYFNDTMKVNAMSLYHNNHYYYVDKDNSIYELSSDNENKCLTKEKHISGICALNNYIYYIAHENLFRYDIETEHTELLDDNYGYRYLSSDNNSVYALRYINANFTDYRLLRITDNETYEFIPDDNNADNVITVLPQDEDIKYICNNTPFRSFCGIANKNNSIVFRSNGKEEKNLLYFSNDKIIVSDEKFKDQELLSYNKDGTLENTINIPEKYSCIPQNIYCDNTNIYMLLQSQDGYNFIGYYNLPQRRHKTDAVVKYDTEKGIFEFIYETRSKYERIVGYKDGFIICLRNNRLYHIDPNTREKEKSEKINISNAVFEICGNKIFVWDDNKFYNAYDMN